MNMKPTRLFAWMVVGSAVGLISTFWQMMEKITLLKNKDAVLTCNINDVLSCSNVLNAPQSSVFGPPNAMIGMVMFGFFLAVALVGLTGGKLANKFALMVQGFALFMLGFTLWFLFQSTYRILSICLFCLFIGTGVLIINAAMLRHNLKFLPIGASTRKSLSKFVERGGDLFVWGLLWLGVAIAMALKFA